MYKKHFYFQMGCQFIQLSANEESWKNGYQWENSSLNRSRLQTVCSEVRNRRYNVTFYTKIWILS